MEVSEDIDVTEATGAIDKGLDYPWPDDPLTVRYAGLTNPSTGEHLLLTEAKGRPGYSVVKRSRQEYPLESIAHVRRPEIRFASSSRGGTAEPEASNRALRIEKSPEPPVTLTARRKAEHRERVAQARKSMPDPQAVLERMVSESLGPEGLEVIEDYLNERLGGTEPADGNNG